MLSLVLQVVQRVRTVQHLTRHKECALCVFQDHPQLVELHVRRALPERTVIPLVHHRARRALPDHILHLPGQQHVSHVLVVEPHPEPVQCHAV
jgi:hypothetical protein